MALPLILQGAAHLLLESLTDHEVKSRSITPLNLQIHLDLRVSPSLVPNESKMHKIDNDKLTDTWGTYPK